MTLLPFISCIASACLVSFLIARRIYYAKGAERCYFMHCAALVYNLRKRGKTDREINEIFEEIDECFELPEVAELAEKLKNESDEL